MSIGNWIRLKDAPTLDWEATSTASYKRLIQLNKEEFVVMLKHFHTNHIQFIKYNVLRNEWSQIISYPFLGAVDAVAQTSTESVIYIVDSKHLHIIDLNLKLRKLVPLDESIILFFGYCAVNAHQTVHVFESHGHPGTHLVWNVNNNTPFQPFPTEFKQQTTSNKPQLKAEINTLCAACVESKPRSAFSKSQLSKTQRVRRCKTCVKNKIYIKKQKTAKKKEEKEKTLTEEQIEPKVTNIPDFVKEMNMIKFVAVRSGVYVPFKNILVIFGIAYDKKDWRTRTNESMWKYDINTNVFSQIFSHPLPYFHGHIVTKDSKYIILLYKETTSDWSKEVSCDEIWESGIYALDMTDNDHFILRKSSISFPVALRTYDWFHVTKTGENTELNRILIIGFVKQINGHIPNEIVCCIANWFGSEMLHVILQPSKRFYRQINNNETKEHYTIPIDDILNSLN